MIAYRDFGIHHGSMAIARGGGGRVFPAAFFTRVSQSDNQCPADDDRRRGGNLTLLCELRFALFSGVRETVRPFLRRWR